MNLWIICILQAVMFLILSIVAWLGDNKMGFYACLIIGNVYIVCSYILTMIEETKG